MREALQAGDLLVRLAGFLPLARGALARDAEQGVLESLDQVRGDIQRWLAELRAGELRRALGEDRRVVGARELQDPLVAGPQVRPVVGPRSRDHAKARRVVELDQPETFGDITVVWTGAEGLSADEILIDVYEG